MLAIRRIRTIRPMQSVASSTERRVHRCSSGENSFERPIGCAGGDEASERPTWSCSGGIRTRSRIKTTPDDHDDARDATRRTWTPTVAGSRDRMRGLSDGALERHSMIPTGGSMSDVTELMRNAYSVITREQNGRLIRVARTSVPLDIADRLDDASKQLLQIVPVRERTRLALLLDVREAPLRSDDAFEKAMRPVIERLVEGFKVRATLVRTAIGKLQLSRTARERNTSATVFDDDRAAVAHLIRALDAARTA
jgi:hypothetical protein